MKKICITIGNIALALAVLGTIGCDTSGSKTWALTELEGFRLGESRSDFLFNTPHVECYKKELSVSSCDAIAVKVGPKDEKKYVRTLLSVFFSGDVISKISTYDDNVLAKTVPFSNVEGLIRRKGDPDILHVDMDYSGRTYTYVEQDVTISFRFHKNEIMSIDFGDVELSDTSMSVWNLDEDPNTPFETFGAGEYIVNGQNLCPSSEAPTCPFDELHEIKEEFKDLKPKDLL